MNTFFKPIDSLLTAILKLTYYYYYLAAEKKYIAHFFEQAIFSERYNF